MTGGLHPYPRFQGELATRSRLGVLVEQELRAVLRSRWGASVLLLGVAWGVASIIELQQLREVSGATHDGRGFLDMLGQLLWFSLAVAATAGGPALLEDARSGALELYFSRAVTRHEYVAGKVLALLALTTLTVLLPALAYWGASHVFYEGHPGWWARALPGAALVALLWGLMVSGLALGASALARSTGAVALVLLGAFATLDLLVDPPALLQRVATVTALTERTEAAVLSPFTWMEAQEGWLFGLDRAPDFPFWWGLLGLGALTVLGWALVLWRHPKARGEDDG